ncbi:hypothetical protein GCM10009715_27910 [Paeniglutamicibacter psychrophenolicus]|uniref:Uncharacterized protein n=1 Tax=Paeniglutamicibacter psychrophenolicus TaxID=257454 RepID=A0ABS4WEV3_9MICC|nr:hypothetical protein [Paeniglutamicibacter psychrophenolicus]
MPASIVSDSPENTAFFVFGVRRVGNRPWSRAERANGLRCPPAAGADQKWKILEYLCGTCVFLPLLRVVGRDNYWLT